MYELDREDREVLDAFENERLVRSGNFDQIRKEAQSAASNTLRKTKRIYLRISERDLDLARIRALEEGLPYQTMLSSVIHKFLAGRLIERR
jgi:predicted DNA binding CopG/RHH family protein